MRSRKAWSVLCIRKKRPQEDSPQKRSNADSSTCRQRKLKCDEVIPTCGQCKRASRTCLHDPNGPFRHHHNPSVDVQHSEVLSVAANMSPDFQPNQCAFDDDTHWVPIPKHIVFVGPSRSSDGDILCDKDYHENPYSPESRLEVASSVETISNDWEPLVVANHDFCEPQCVSSLGAGTDNQHELPSDVLSATMSTEITAAIASPTYLTTSRESDINPSTSPQTNDSGIDIPIDRAEISFLMKHFSVTTGLWMDLFDLKCYFSRRVPVEASSNHLLQQASCAYAAKQLGRIQKRARKQYRSSKSYVTSYSDFDATDWSVRASKYYDSAVCLLMKTLALADVPKNVQSPQISSSGELHESPPILMSISASSSTNGIIGVGQPNSTHYISDNTLAAAAILCVYEFMEHENAIWLLHLSGTKTLIDVTVMEEAISLSSYTLPSSAQIQGLSAARKAIFWNFARQDYLAAFINGQKTRLDPTDLDLWRRAGLALDESGSIIHDDRPSKDEYEIVGAVQEDMKSNTLIWILCKLTNFLAATIALNSLSGVKPRESMENLLRNWQEIKLDLENWFSGLSVMFKPTARLPIVARPSLGAEFSPREIFEEVWFSLPMCASTMQSYHMAYILMELNKPQISEAGNASRNLDTMSSYRALVTKVNTHSREICGIALSNSDEGVRIHSVQPLFIVGQCLVEPAQRMVVLDLLRGIESDLGWATEYRVQKLLLEWE